MRRAPRAFSLVEVVLAVGVLTLAILALLGLFGPTMSSVRDVVDSNEASGVVTRLNAALFSDDIYDYTTLGGFGTFAGSLAAPAANQPYLLYFWSERSDINTPLDLKFSDTPPGSSELPEMEGQAFIVALEQGMQGVPQPPAYPFDFGAVDLEGYFPILVSIYPIGPAELVNAAQTDIDSLVTTTEPVFTYTTAKLR